VPKLDDYADELAVMNSIPVIKYVPTEAPPVLVETSRDYVREMKAILDQHLTNEQYNAAEIARTVVAELRREDPDLLLGWLSVQAVRLVRETILKRDSTFRGENRQRAAYSTSRSVFRDAAAEFERTGDDKPLRSRFMAEVYVIPDGSRVPLRLMTADQLNFAADDFQQRGRESLFREAFLRAVATRCGDRTVEEVFDEGQLARLWLSIATPR